MVRRLDLFQFCATVEQMINRWSVQIISEPLTELDTTRLLEAYHKYGPVARSVYHAYGDEKEPLELGWFDGETRSTFYKIKCLRDLQFLTGHVYSSGYRIHYYAEVLVCLR